MNLDKREKLLISNLTLNWTKTKGIWGSSQLIIGAMKGGVRGKGRGDSSLRMTTTPNRSTKETDKDPETNIVEITEKESGLGESLICSVIACSM